MVRVELRVMAMKEYFTLLRSPELEVHHQLQLGVGSYSSTGKLFVSAWHKAE